MKNTEQLNGTELIKRDGEKKQTEQKKSLKIRLRKLWNTLQPSLFTVIMTFTVFFITLLIVKTMVIPSLVAIMTYGFLVFIVQPLFGERIKKVVEAIFGRNREIVRLIKTKNDSVIIQQIDNSLIAISLLQVTALAYPVELRYLWDFLQEEEIFIQDCLEGCFLIIKKKTKKIPTKNLQELAVEVVKAVHQTIIRTIKRFELEYENIDLKLVRGQERILAILNLGLSPEKFSFVQEMPEEDLAYLRKPHLVPDDEDEEELQEGGFYDVSDLPSSMF